MAGSYVAANLGVSLSIARTRGWRFARTLPLAFAGMHLAWGAGFLAGLGAGFARSWRRR